MNETEFRSKALEAYDSWQGILRTDRDDYNAYAELTAIYRQALLDPNQPIAHALEQAWAGIDIDQ